MFMQNQIKHYEQGLTDDSTLPCSHVLYYGFEDIRLNGAGASISSPTGKRSWKIVGFVLLPLPGRV
jgi:hypothetical protein